MGLFDIFRKKKELTPQELRWNKMWDLWADGKIASPYAELMTYQSEINNGGHDQYFINVDNNGNLKKEMSELKRILSPRLRNNLNDAYSAFLALEKSEDDETAEEVLNKCDDVFFKNEEEINRILKEHSLKI